MSDGEINVDSIDGEVSTSANIVGQLYPQGEKGDKGDPGNDGFSPTVTTEKVGKTTTITITDAQGEHTATILDGADGQGSGDMRTEVYDVNQNGIVDNAEKVNNHTVNSDVPADAVFTDTTYTAGTGIDITGNVITNTQTSAEWGNITGTLSDQTDLKNALDDKANTSDIPTKVSDLNNDSGFIDKDVNNLTNYDTSTTVDTKISNSEEVLIGSDSGIKASHELWVDTSDVTPYINSEISNEYGTAQNLGYSQEYQNAHNVVVSPTTPTTNEKVWFAHSKNLWKQLPSTKTLNGITLTNNKNGTFNLSGTATANTSFYVELDLVSTSLKNGTYTLSKKSAGYNIQLDFYNGTTYVSTPIYCYGNNLSGTASISIGSSVNKVRYIIYIANGSSVSLTNEQIMLNKGSTALPYEPYITPSINVNGEEIYSKSEIELLYNAPVSISIPSAYSAQTIPLTEPTVVGDKLTFNNTDNAIIIGDNVHHIEVSANLIVANGSNNLGERYHNISKNGTNITNSYTINTFATNNHYQIVIPSALLSVTQGDKISAKVSSSLVETLSVRRGYLTVKVID